MEHLEEGTIHAWLDGALSEEEGREIERHIADCAQCSAAVAEARGLIAMASRVLTSLDDVPAGVVPAQSGATIATDDLAFARAKRAARANARSIPWWRKSTYLAAAAVAFVALVSFPVMRRVQEQSVPMESAAASLQARSSNAPAEPRSNVGDSAKGLPQAPAPAPVVAQTQPGSREAGVTSAAKQKKEDAVADAAAPPAAIAGAAVRADVSKASVPSSSAARVSIEEKVAGAPTPPPGRVATLNDSASERRVARDAVRQLGQVVVSGAGAAPDVRAKSADVSANRVAPSARPQAEASFARQRFERDLAAASPLLGCYSIRLVSANGGALTITSVRLPSHIALDSMRVVDIADVEYQARDTSPTDERAPGVYHWRPTGSRSFELIVNRDGMTLRYAATSGESLTDAVGSVTRSSATSAVRLTATAEPCR